MAHHRESPIEMNNQEFKEIGYKLIDHISDFLGTLKKRPITPGETSEQLQHILSGKMLPETGISSAELVGEAADLVINHSLFNGHPKFLGYITSSAAPIGALADLLAASVNPNVGANLLSPLATEIEKQTINWLSQFIGLPPGYGGILVSGGNMANFTAFLAARNAKASGNFKEEGLSGIKSQMVVYASGATHTWIEKAAVLFGHGMNSIRWIPTDSSNKMNVVDLRKILEEDLKKNYQPFMVIGNAGDVSTGAVDDLAAIHDVCKDNNLWFHVDGAYGMPAAALRDLKTVFKGVEEADSIALDPHKWLYNPLEVGCTLVKNPGHLVDTFSSHPEYYNFDTGEGSLNFYEYGLQNSRGFRALKVWLTLQQAGRAGYIKMISEDIRLSKLMFELADEHPKLEALTQSLSITTFRYIPEGCGQETEDERSYLNKLNEELLNSLQKGGEVFLSNAIVNEKYSLRACIVNFRTSEKDIEEIIEIVVREGAKLHRKLKR